MKHWLVTPTAYGEITAEQVAELAYSIFPCGKCSGPDDKVFHNLLGRHNHARPFKETK